ncbi:MAG: DUF3857 domain-containing protein [Waddliaceae bacterium]|nr:DUF3857 domain-containing protein [Waddliaceae bacterium]
MPYFNHAIVCVSIDGEYILMDPTDEMTKDLLPAYLSNKSFLVARPDGETLLTSPTAPAEDNMMVVVTNANIADSGELRAESSLTFEGINDNAYRNAFANMKESDILRFFESRIAEAIPGATLKHLSIAPTDILDTSVPLSVSITYEATDAVISGDDATIISLPHLGISRQGSNEGFGIINFILSENTSLESRVFPLDLYTTCGVYEDITLSIDKSFGAPISLPDDVENESGTVFWKRDLDYSIDRTTTKLHETSTFMIKTLEFSPEEYLSLKDTIKDVEYDQRKVPILSKDNDEEIYYDDDGDIVIENLLIDYDIIDENSWTKTVAIKKEVLTYGGKKDNSEITVRYNPSWDNIDIVDITITDADGTTHHPNNNEINIMDATWVGSAPRYPAEKLLTIVLPGVDIGSTIEHTLRHTYTKRPFFSTMETFRYLDPLSSKKVTITAPKKIELQTLKTDAGIAVEAPNDGIIAESIDDNDDKTIFQWEAYNISSAKESSLPPPWYCYNPTVLCSSGTWEKYAPVVSKTLHSAVDDADAMEDLFDKITSDFDDDKAVIAAVRDYVDKKVRLVPIAFYDMPLSAISPAAKTLNDGYGHSADRAIVLYSILSAGGLDPEFVMASYSTDIDIIKNHVQGLPDFTLFGEILVRVPHEEGYVYLNDTSRHAAIGTTPHNGFLGIVIDDAELITIGSLPDTKERKYDSYNISLDDTGAATITYNKAFYGVGYQNMKDMFDAMSPEDLRRYQNDIAATFSTSATVVDDITINFSKHPGTMSINIAIDNFAVVDNENMYFTLPHTLKELFPTSSEKRTIPLLWDSSLDITILTTITLPEGYTEILIAPEDLRYELPNNAGDIVVSSSYDDNTITLIHTTKILPALFDAAEYSVLKDINEKLSHPRSRTIMVKNENNDQ